MPYILLLTSLIDEMNQNIIQRETQLSSKSTFSIKCSMSNCSSIISMIWELCLRQKYRLLNVCSTFLVNLNKMYMNVVTLTSENRKGVYVSFSTNGWKKINKIIIHMRVARLLCVSIKLVLITVIQLQRTNRRHYSLPLIVVYSADRHIAMPWRQPFYTVQIVTKDKRKPQIFVSFFFVVSR